MPNGGNLANRQGRLAWERDLLLQQTAQASYDRLSGFYDWLAKSEMPFNRRGVELLEICSGQTVLEIGYGTGHNLLQLAGLVGVSGRVAGVDLSSGMARVAGARLSKSGQGQRVQRGLGDARLLPYPGGCFDAVFMAFTLELFSPQDISRVLHEVHRVLRVGGRLGVVALSQPDAPGLMVRVYEWFHRTWPNIVDCHPIPAAQLLRQNGFSIRELERKMMWGLPVELVCAAKG